MKNDSIVVPEIGIYQYLFSRLQTLDFFLKPILNGGTFLDEYPGFYNLRLERIDCDEISIKESKKILTTLVVRLEGLRHTIEKLVHDFQQKIPLLKGEEAIGVLRELYALHNKIALQLRATQNRGTFLGQVNEILKKETNYPYSDLDLQVIIICFEEAFGFYIKEVYASFIKTIGEIQAIVSKSEDVDLFNEVLLALKTLQGIRMAIRDGEKYKTKVLASYMRMFVAKDESRWGVSDSNIDIGEVDIVIENRLAGGVVAILEAIEVKLHWRTKTIVGHLNKIFKYDANGLPENYFVLFIHTNDDLIKIQDKYLKLIKSAEITYPMVEINEYRKDGIILSSDILMLKSIHKRNLENISVIHFLVQIR